MENLAPPAGFCDLSAAYHSSKDTMISVIGVVVDYMPPTTTARGELMLTVKLLDPKLRDALHGSQGYTLRFFGSAAVYLPQIRGVGDVIMARRMKSMPFNNQPMALSNRAETRCLVFVNGSVPDPTYSIAFMDKNRIPSVGSGQGQGTFTLHEQEYIIFLRKEMHNYITNLLSTNATRKREFDALAEVSVGPKGKNPGQSTFGRKFHLIKQLGADMYADICVEVVKKDYVNPGQKVELYVTDYTENRRLSYHALPEEIDEDDCERDENRYSEAGNRPWPGPFGHMVLKVVVREPHASRANIWGKEGTLLLLKNVKLNRKNHIGDLDGHMWPDDKDKDKNNVKRVYATSDDHPEIRQLLERKERYLASRAEIHHKSKQAVVDAEKVRIDKQRTPQEKSDKKRANQKKNKVAKRERKKVQMQERERDLFNRITAETLNKEATQHLSVSLSETAAGQNSTIVKAADPVWQENHHIRANFTQVPIQEVLNVLDLRNHRHFMKTAQGADITIPFANTRARVLVRVVDFEPSLEQFATAKLNDSRSSHAARSAIETPLQEFKWQFILQLEDASLGTDGNPVRGPDGKPVRITVRVFHKEAQYLLGNDMPDPVDLTENPNLLAKLREKMCILWGNLEEWKGSKWTLKGGLKNKPFVCCIAEYGIDAKKGDPKAKLGMRKCFKLTDTTIM